MRKKTSAPTPMYCTVEDVKRITCVDYTDYNLKEENKDKLDDILNEWIGMASEAIEKYCGKKFKEPIPQTVRLVCTTITANIIAFGQSRKETPTIRKDDWTIKLLGADFFTDDLKSLLDPFVVEEEEDKKCIDLFAITGD